MATEVFPLSHYNVERDKPHPDDPVREAPKHVKAALPKKKTVRPPRWPVWNQGSLASCTAHAVAGAAQYCLFLRKMPAFTPSCLFMYYFERVFEKSVDTNSGCIMKDAIDTLQKYGVCCETMWPYVDDQKLFKVKPPPHVMDFAASHKEFTGKRVPQELDEMKACLVEEGGHPFTISISLWDEKPGEEDWPETLRKSGIIPMPNTDKEENVGWHAMLVVGYDDDRKAFNVRNSAGAKWGEDGYGWLPYDFAVNKDLAESMWEVRYTG